MASRIKALRIARGLSQSDLAYLCGVSVLTIRRWEHGVSVPRRRSMVKLARRLGITREELAGSPPAVAP